MAIPFSKEYRRLTAAYRECFHSEPGAIVLEDLQKLASRQSFDPANQYQTAFNEGERAAVLRILRMIQIGSSPPAEENPA